MGKLTETLMNIEIFDFTDVEPYDEGYQYSDIEFKFESLKQYTGLVIEVNSNWDIKVWNEDTEVTHFNIIDVIEFKDQLKEI